MTRLLKQAILAAESPSKMDATIAGEPTVVSRSVSTSRDPDAPPSCLQALGSRTRRGAYQEPASDPAITAEAVARTLPGMIQDAEDAGLTIVALRLATPSPPSPTQDLATG